MHIRLYTCHSATLIAVIRKRSNTRQKWDNYQTLVQGRRHQILIGGGGVTHFRHFSVPFGVFSFGGGGAPPPSQFFGGAAAPPAPCADAPVMCEAEQHTHMYIKI